MIKSATGFALSHQFCHLRKKWYVHMGLNISIRVSARVSMFCVIFMRVLRENDRPSFLIANFPVAEKRTR